MKQSRNGATSSVGIPLPQTRVEDARKGADAGEMEQTGSAARSRSISPGTLLVVRSSLGYALRRYPLGAAGAVIVAAMVLMALCADWITVFDPTATNSRISLARP